jgi:exopolyphosphatase/guanosine-5'-triphosphate,3'-diphosphate pyrophosphatase
MTGLELTRLAAIDIGSNAVRLLIINVIPTKDHVVLKKVSLTRVPIRLGADVFSTGLVSTEKTDKLVEAMQGFKHLMAANSVLEFRACATSAMREAENRQEVIDRIRSEAGITIEILDGKNEAALIFASEADQLMELAMPCMYVDVGGGSTELTLFEGEAVIDSKSLNIGTVRTLHGRTSDDEWDAAQAWVEKHRENYAIHNLIGTGGNINKLIRLATERKQSRGLVGFQDLKESASLLNSLSYEERIVQLNLNPDRADVIIHATNIFMRLMEWSGAQSIYVPQAGLSDGIIHQLYHEHLDEKYGSLPMIS